MTWYPTGLPPDFKVAVVGDSLTVGAYAHTPWRVLMVRAFRDLDLTLWTIGSERDQRDGLYYVEGRHDGVAGYSAVQMAADIETRVLDWCPVDIAIIGLGTNTSAPGAFTTAMGTIRDAVSPLATHLYVTRPPPRHDDVNANTLLDSLIAVIDGLGVDTIDLNTDFGTGLMDADLIHPNNAGNVEIWSRIAATLAADVPGLESIT